MIWILPLLLVVVFELIADIAAKFWSLQINSAFWIITILGYTLAGIFWLLALKNGAGLGRGVVIFSLISEILAVLIGLIYFHEKISTIQAFGIGLGILSLVLIFWDW